jgi:hypothetical protein
MKDLKKHAKNAFCDNVNNVSLINILSGKLSDNTFNIVSGMFTFESSVDSWATGCSSGFESDGGIGCQVIQGQSDNGGGGNNGGGGPAIERDFGTSPQWVLLVNNQGNPANSVPEPSTVVILLFALMLLTRRSFIK